LSITFRRLFEASPSVVRFRAWQALQLAALRASAHWPRLAGRVRSFWTAERVASWAAAARAGGHPLASRGRLGFDRWVQEHPEPAKSLRAHGHAVARGQVMIFDRQYSFDVESMPWHSDWRWNRRWVPGYYRKYRFYERVKSAPYDVKFPWELSRFAFVIPLFQAGLLEGSHDLLAIGAKWLARWEEENPVAYSVNWQPMEASMRALSLVLGCGMLASERDLPPSCLAPFVRELTVHGEFLFRNLEFSDHRGNHYAANLVALLWLGLVLRAEYGPARK